MVTNMLFWPSQEEKDVMRTGDKAGNPIDYILIDQINCIQVSNTRPGITSDSDLNHTTLQYPTKHN